MDASDQEVQTLLRERFLRLISSLSNGQTCNIELWENTDVTCQVRALLPNLESVIVENLSTNYPKPVGRAILRGTDIVSMHFKAKNLP